MLVLARAALFDKLSNKSDKNIEERKVSFEGQKNGSSSSSDLDACYRESHAMDSTATDIFTLMELIWSILEKSPVFTERHQKVC